MKKLLALLLALVMVMSMTACVTEGDEEESRATISMPSAVTELKEWKNTDIYPLETDTVLRVLFTEDGLGDTDMSRLWEEVTGVKVENLTWTNEQMFTSIAAGDIPDAIVMPWNFTKDKVWELHENLVDFTQYLDKMPNMCALIKKYPEILEVCAYPDGGMYSLPKVGWNNAYQSNVMYIRTDIMEELGWEKAPASVKELLDFLKQAQEHYKDDPEFKAFVPSSKTFMDWDATNSIALALFSSFGDLVETGLTLNSDKEVVLGAATEQYRYYLEYMNELWNSGAFETEVYTADATALKSTIKNGHCAVSIGTCATIAAFSDGVLDIEILQPLVSEYSGVKKWMKLPEVQFRACIANKNCKDLDTLLVWLDSFYAPYTNPLNEEGTVWAGCASKGVEGVNWTIDHEAKSWASGAKFTNYYDSLYIDYGQYLPEEGSDLYIKSKGTNENLLPYAKEVSGLTNLVLSESDQDDYADIWGDMESYISQMHGKFVTGQEDIETGWDNYLSTLDRMGLPEILEMYQDTYDAQ